MEVSATAKFVRISPTKVRDLTRAIQGKPVGEALRITEFNKRKGAFVVGKTLKSALANAEHNAGLAVEDLYVKTAVVDNGPMIKRFRPAARGMAKPIQKKTSHISVTLSDRKPARASGRAA
jgi:large subunit ribosomal protein L22